MSATQLAVLTTPVHPARRPDDDDARTRPSLPSPAAPPPAPPPPRQHKNGALVVAAFAITFVAVGMPNSFGIFQDYYASTLFPDTPPAQIILVGSLASSLYMILGAPAGRFADRFGYDVAVLVGAVLVVAGLFAASVCTRFYQFLLAQGVTFGLGAAFVYYPAVSVSRRLFARRHGVANAVVVSGGALGGCVLPYATRVLLRRHGLPATFRTLGCLAAALLGCAWAAFCWLDTPVVRPRGRPTARLLDLALLRDRRFLVLLAATSVAMTGFLPRYFLITPSAVAQGVDAAYAAWLLGLMNGLSIAGRLGIGAFADRYGTLTGLVASFLLCGAGHLLFWLPGVLRTGHDAVALLTVFVVFVGLLGSGFVSLIPVVVSDLFGSDNLASKVGLFNSIVGVGVLAGPSVANAIVAGRSHSGHNGHGGHDDWSMAVVFSGLAMLVGGLLLTRTFRYL
ncbi:hypothetical protein SPBR_09079 [Sporothrix brasiliensis 5110]|uniref:Major facilitator superfamily (MFS) profile domain-containing protein n=1 Tax=Sporothrix brasiliensis 5110 TaxID=1398154 RepID=A0A0C2EX72_9PEZI|nr:uncharacterized protein SPBR_09079 [Sporothrix brasiliensis 5110]KIH91174.1 hypothetical protein SPBR_09079 [Sporothrix brasiliensis 5110]